MKKKFLAIVMAAAMALALPALAFAADSPSGTTVTNDDGVSFSVSVGSSTGSGNLIVEAAASQASNVVLSSSDVVLGSFEAYTTGDYSVSDLTLSFYVGTEYNGATATIYVEHGDGTTEILTSTVTDGYVSTFVDGLSVFTIVIDTDTVAADTDTTTDSSSKSPQTGVDTTTVAGITAIAALGAGAVFVALRKKMTA